MNLFCRSNLGFVVAAFVMGCSNSEFPSAPGAIATSAMTDLRAAYLAAAHADLDEAFVGVEQAQLTASDGAPNDRLGISVAVDGDTALVGALADDIGTNANQGSAYVFIRMNGAWTEQQKLTASDGAAEDGFGYSVALSGDTALVGVKNSVIGDKPSQGSAYVFTRKNGIWAEQQKLIASDGAADDAFGNSVALSGDTALIGAQYDDFGANENQGSAYVFIRAGATWIEQQKLITSDGAAGDYFGHSVALSGNTALVGAFLDDIDAQANQGSAYVFTRNGATWTEQQKLIANDGAELDHGGCSVALSGDTALVGADGDDVGANDGAGSAYVFTRSGTIWTQQQHFIGSNGEGFGRAVVLAGDAALVTNHIGEAHMFARTGEVWMEQQELVAGPFISAVALSGDTAVVGTDLDGATGSRGAAYVFVLRKGTGDACVRNAECASGLCEDGVCKEIASGSSSGAGGTGGSGSDGGGSAGGGGGSGNASGDAGGAAGNGGNGDGGSGNGSGNGNGNGNGGGAVGSGGSAEVDVDDPASCACSLAGDSSGKTYFGTISIVGVAFLAALRRRRVNRV